MIIYDAIHGYQPFSAEFKFPWVDENLDSVFLPTSEAMKRGVVRRAVQLQGCTIQEWLREHDTHDKALVVLGNLRLARRQGHIEIGCSSFSHAILPLLSEESIYAQILLDKEIVETHLGKCTWFWPPEGAVDAKTLQVLWTRFPELVAFVPNKCLRGAKNSAFVKVRHAKGTGKIAVFNVLVKDVLMNSVSYAKRPAYVPSRVKWKYHSSFMKDPHALEEVLGIVDGKNPHIVMRDWENAESRDALFNVMPQAMDIMAFANAKWRHDAEFSMPASADYSDTIKISDIKLSSWEPMATQANPLPYWDPAGSALKKLDKHRKAMIDGWKRIYAMHDSLFRQIVLHATSIPAEKARKMKLDARLALVDKALSAPDVKQAYLDTAMALISCTPWHLLARPEWEHSDSFPKRAMHKMIKAKMHHLINFCHERDILGTSEMDRLKEEVDVIAAHYF